MSSQILKFDCGVDLCDNLEDCLRESKVWSQWINLEIVWAIVQNQTDGYQQLCDEQSKNLWEVVTTSTDFLLTRELLEAKSADLHETY